MSTQMPSRYQPSDRLVDDRDRLRELYCSDGLTIREIAQEYAEVGRTKVSDAIREHGIDEEIEQTKKEKQATIEQDVCDFTTPHSGVVTDSRQQVGDDFHNEKNTDRGTDPPSWVDLR